MLGALEESFKHFFGEAKISLTIIFFIIFPTRTNVLPYLVFPANLWTIIKAQMPSVGEGEDSKPRVAVTSFDIYDECVYIVE